MTCDGGCFGRLAHFCLVPVCLSVFMSWSVDSVPCFDDALSLCFGHGREFFPFPPPSRLFSSHLHLLFLLLSATFVPFALTLSWPRLFWSFPFPCLSFSLSFLSFLLTFALAFLSLPATSVISLYFIFSPLFSPLQSPPSPVLHCLFVSSSPSVLIPSVSLTLIFSISLPLAPPFLSLPLFLSLSVTSIIFSSVLLIHPSVHLVHPFNTLPLCPCSVTREKPPSCCMTFCTPSPSRSS